MLSSGKKINWLLILQGWAMLWVVIGHSFLGVAGEGPKWENTLFRFAYSFHMPLFMLLSGWLFYRTRLRFFSQWSYMQIIKDKALRLLWPGFVFSLFAFALKIAFPGEITRQVGLSINEIFHQFLYPNDNPMRELWFIVTLFWLFLLTPLWRMVLSKTWTQWGVLLILIVLHFLHPKIELLCLNRVFIYAIWFYCGLIISKTDFVDKVLANNAYKVLFVGIIIYIIGCLTVSFITTIGGIIASFGIALIADNRLPKLFSSFRNYTYQIFLMGIFAQMLVKIVYRHNNLYYFPTYLICIFAGIFIPVMISIIIERINWYPLKSCVGLK